jgi:hypothetical protein
MMDSIFSTTLLDIMIRPMILEAAISRSEYFFTSSSSFSVDQWLTKLHLIGLNRL